jgi:hypothetical protein
MAPTAKFGKIIWNEPALDYLLKSPVGPVGRDLSKRGNKVLAAARIQVGVSTENLKKSLKVTAHDRSVRGQFVKVGSTTVKYALAHHEGTRPHIITPKRAQVMVFESKGSVIYATRVKHPGTKANRYLSDNLYLAL